MTFAVINWLNISINLLLVIFVIVCLLMTLLILMQRPKQEGLGATFGGGVTDQVFGARTTNVLQRGTVYLGSLFFILSLALAVLIGQKNKTFSTVTKADLAAKAEAAKTAIKPVEVAPKPLSEQLAPVTPIPVETPAPVVIPADAPKEVTQVPDIAPVVPAEPSPPIVPVVPDTPIVPAVPAEAETPKDK